MIEKRYDYKMFYQGQFLGLLPNVTSPFEYGKRINTGSVEISIDVDQSLDTASEAVEEITTELGEPIQTEDGQTLTTERSTELIGVKGSGLLIATDNDIEVWEYSEDYPNGIKVFAGYISSWDGEIGNGLLTLRAISYGKDLGDYIFGNSSFVSFFDQLSSDVNFDIGRDGQVPGGSSIAGHIMNMTGQTITSMSGSLTKVSVVAATGNDVRGVYPASANLTLRFYEGIPNGSSTLLDTVTISISNVAPNYQNASFILNSTITLESTKAYYFTVMPDDYVQFKWATNNPYPNGTAITVATGYSSTILIDSISDMAFSLYQGTIVTNASFADTEISDIIRTSIDGYNSQGGSVTYTATSIDDTGVLVDYDFIMATPQEIIEKCRELAGEDWYSTVDPGTQILTFKQTPATPDHTFTLGEHIESMRLGSTIEGNVNVVYFTGGPTAGINLLKKYTDDSSLATDRVGMERLNDPHIVTANEPSGRKLAENLMAENRGERFKAPVLSILADRYDISTIDVGQSVAVNGFGNFVDDLVLQVNNINRQEDMIVLTLGKLPVDVNQQVEDTRRGLSQQQTLDNPASPG